MKKLKYLFTAIAVIAVLAGCSKKDIERFIEDPTTIIKGEVVFSNQSEDTYAVVVESSQDVEEQFNISGNKKITKKYSIGSYKVRLKQQDGYIFYPSEFTVTFTLSESGKTLCWDNSQYWFK